MIEEPKTLTIRAPQRRPSAAQIGAFQNVPTGFVVDAMFGTGSLATQIIPIPGQDLQVAGPALTVDNRPSDILALLGALKFIQAGDIVVNGFAGFQGCAAAGDRLSGMMKNCGAAGFVTDGPMRDLDGIRAVGLPCWCTGLNPGSPYSTGPGKIGLPVQIGGQNVDTGDMIVADKDGIVVVPFDMLDHIIGRLEAVAALEHDMDGQVAEGLCVPDSIEQMLQDADKVVHVTE